MPQDYSIWEVKPPVHKDTTVSVNPSAVKKPYYNPHDPLSQELTGTGSSVRAKELQDLAKKNAADAKAAEAEKKRKAYEAQQQQKMAFKVPDADLIAAQAYEQRKESNFQAEQANQQQQAARSSQQQYIQGLQEQSAGSTNTAAQKALQASSDRSAAQQKAVAASQAGATSAGLRGQARSAAQSGQQTLQASDQLKVQEQLAARQQLAQALGQQRQQDIGSQQLASQSEMQGLSDQQKLALIQQQASASGETLKVEEELAKKGIKLSSDISDIQANAANSKAIGSGLGAVGGAIVGSYFGVPGVGASLGGSLGGMLFNKGGKVAESKNPKNSKNTSMPKNMTKEEQFGFKKALKSNTGVKSNYAEGGTANRKMTAGEMPRVIPGTGLDINALRNKYNSQEDPYKDRYENASTVKGVANFRNAALVQTLKSGEAKKQAITQGAESRASQAALSNQFKDQAAGTGPSLANLQLKSKGDASLVQQLAAAQSGKSPVAAAQLQQALAQSQQQQAGSIAQQAAQLAAQESQQAYQQGLGLDQNLRAGDISQQQMAQQMAQQSVMQEASTRQAEQQASQQLLSLQIDREAALAAHDAAKRAAKKASSGGLFSGLFNSGGKIPGKSNVPGDDIKNDTVPAMLSPGEVVIPITVVNKGKDAMIGFIKGIEQMTKGGKTSEDKRNNKMNIATKVKNYAYGTVSAGNYITEEDKLKEEEEKLQKAEKNKTGIKTDKSEKQEYTKKEASKVEKTDKEKSDKEKADSATKTQAGIAIASQAGQILGNIQARKNKVQEDKIKTAQMDFREALSRIKGRRNYAKGGKVSSCGYGAVLEAKNKNKKG